MRNAITMSEDTKNWTKAANASQQEKAEQYLYLQHQFVRVQMHAVIGYGLMFLLSMALVVYLRHKRNGAYAGDVHAARSLILPSFEPLLWILCVSLGSYTIFFVFAVALQYTSWLFSPISVEAIYAGRQFIFLLVILYFYQRSVSYPALIRSVLVAAMLALCPIITASIIKFAGGASIVNYVVQCTFRSCLSCLYLYMLIWPRGRASPLALREFCVYSLGNLTLVYTYQEFFRQDYLKTATNIVFVATYWDILCPLFFWRLLKADTEHWRGLGQRACSLQNVFCQKNQMHEIISAQGLHVLIEMHRKYIIDFAHLRIFTPPIGSGASANVFRGKLNSRIDVAIKVYTPVEIDDMIVGEFSHEAALCGALEHPNIVTFYGMCVCPPTICLVSELCRGNLRSILLEQHLDYCDGKQYPSAYTMASSNKRSNKRSNNRQQFIVNLCFMLDTARSITYLHSFRPSFIHRDIKPANLLVDTKNNVKLTDFGDSTVSKNSHSNQRPLRTSLRQSVKNLQCSGANDSYTAENIDELMSSFAELSSTSSSFQSRCSKSKVKSQSKSSTKKNYMTVRGTIDYMAPEVINGKNGHASYTESADVFSLAMTLWDILHPTTEKYPTAKKNHFQIFELVVNGVRPEFHPQAHPTLKELIELAWCANPEMRPTAQNIVIVLETLQDETCAIFAKELSQNIEYCSNNTNMRQNKHNHHRSALFTGMQAVQCMLEHEYVKNEAESIRLGNALMDAGYIHHVKHTRGFENTSSLYLFDEGNIDLHQPCSNQDGVQSTCTSSNLFIFNQKFIGSKVAVTEHSSENSSSLGDNMSKGYQNNGRNDLLGCACQKLAQGFKANKSTFGQNVFNKQKKTAGDENALTVRLLANDILIQEANPDNVASTVA